MVTLDEIDQTLADWRQKVKAASTNVFELTDNLTYKRLTGDGGLPKADLSGVTRDAVAPALAAMTELWQSFALLTDVVERAEEVRKSVSKIFVSQDKLDKIWHLLHDASVKLPAIQTPLAQRGLLTPVEVTQSISPVRLLEAMNQAFTAARTAVLEVDEAWNRLEPALAEAEAEIGRLQKVAVSVGEGSLPELLAAQDRVGSLRQQVLSDPLGVRAGFDRDVQPLLARLRVRLDDLASQRERLLLDLQGAHPKLQALASLHADCDGAWAQCLESIEHPPTLSRKDPQLLASLEARVGNMECHLADGTWTLSQVAKGMETWRQQSAAFQEAEQKALDACNALLKQREELQGMLLVYKRRAEKRGVVEDLKLADLFRQAEFYLHRPQKTPLDLAGSLVAQYRERIASLTGGDA